MRLSTILRMRKSDNGRTPDNAEEGIYVYSIDGYLYTKEEWDTSKNNNVVGIGIIKNNHKFVVDITGFKTHSCVFYSGVTKTSVPFIIEYDDAVVSYIGYENTQFSLNNDAPDVYSKDSAIKLCNDYIFPNGSRGYLLASGELQIVIKNQVEINNLIQLVGGNVFDFTIEKIIVTSTPSNQDTMYIWGYGHHIYIPEISQDIYSLEGYYDGAYHFVCCKF